ncbi:nucleotidyltransferase family protein [Lachnoclostridium sp. An138]|uniref:nucleotidyltransferase family protein n=1 Tax=Lachnoclostridium sp. An138 TaxID=1965560 RepID=UPI000B39EBD0|nr:nucleotidyltransferase domain-containing protein [Lachnoclostridium sp. An138]OUQ16574.1 toxin [Lachnoclostridium sp. An138]
MQIQEILEEIQRISRQYGAREVILFGSRAKGTETERSDIDIAVSGAERFDELEEAIDEIPTLLSFDVVNMDTCQNELLLKEIREYGRKIL